MVSVVISVSFAIAKIVAVSSVVTVAIDISIVISIVVAIAISIAIDIGVAIYIAIDIVVDYDTGFHLWLQGKYQLFQFTDISTEARIGWFDMFNSFTIGCDIVFYIIEGLCSSLLHADIGTV